MSIQNNASSKAYSQGWNAHGTNAKCNYAKNTALYRVWWRGYFAARKYKQEVKKGVRGHA